MQKNHPSATPMWVRVTALALALLTASGILTYLVLFIIGLFS